MYNAEDYRLKKKQVKKLRTALIIESGILAGFVTMFIIQLFI